MLDNSSEHSPTTKCPADSIEEVRPTTVTTTSAVKKSNNRDKTAVGYRTKEIQFENKNNTREIYQNNNNCKTSQIYSPVSSSLSSTSICSSQSSPPYTNTSYVDSNINHIKNKFTESFNHNDLDADTEVSPSKQNKTFLSNRKKKSLAKLVAAKQIDKNVNKFHHHREIKEGDKGEENSLSTCQSNSRKIRNRKHSKNDNIEHLQSLEESEKSNDIKIRTI